MPKSGSHAPQNARLRRCIAKAHRPAALHGHLVHNARPHCGAKRRAAAAGRARCGAEVELPPGRATHQEWRAACSGCSVRIRGRASWWQMAERRCAVVVGGGESGELWAHGTPGARLWHAPRERHAGCWLAVRTRGGGCQPSRRGAREWMTWPRPLVSVVLCGSSPDPRGNIRRCPQTSLYRLHTNRTASTQPWMSLLRPTIRGPSAEAPTAPAPLRQRRRHPGQVRPAHGTA